MVFDGGLLGCLLGLHKQNYVDQDIFMRQISGLRMRILYVENNKNQFSDKFLGQINVF